MKLTRIAACGAAMLSLLAIPTTALASSPPRPIAVKGMCSPLRAYPKPAPVDSAAPVRTKVVKVPPTSYLVRAVACCGVVVQYGQVPAHRSVVLQPFCPRQTLVFTMPSGGRAITEVRGPRLSVHDAVRYRGRVYTVASVWGHRFTLDYLGKPFVNRGAAIYDGKAVLLRGAVIVVCTAVPRPAPRPVPSK